MDSSCKLEVGFSGRALAKSEKLWGFEFPKEEWPYHKRHRPIKKKKKNQNLNLPCAQNLLGLERYSPDALLTRNTFFV